MIHQWYCKDKLATLLKWLFIYRSAGSYLDIKKHHRAYGSQILKFNHLPVIHIKATFNNTVITILDKNGERWLTSYCIFSLSISVISFLFFFCWKRYYFYFLEKTLGWVSAVSKWTWLLTLNKFSIKFWFWF